MPTSRANLAAATTAVTAVLAAIAIWTQSHLGSSLLPHAFCITGSQPLLMLHVAGDSLIAFAYLLIPWALLNIIRQRADIPFGWIAWLFGAFIVACGATHAVEVWTLWDPVYWYAGVLKAFTAAVSLATAWWLYKLTPQILAIPSADALRVSNSQLQRRTEELGSLLKEMESFSSSIAHDLRAPLTTLGGYSQVLLDTEKANLSERGQVYLERVTNAAARMDEIITALLGIARLPHEQLQRVEVDLARVARDIVNELQAAEPTRRCEVQIAPSLPVVGDPVLLRQAMSNLLGNSWKFSSHEDAVRIEVGSTDTPRGQAVFVRDHGAGFDSTRAERLFEMFHRMHSEKEFGGSGVGLAIVKRIVQRHGGDIWADSAPGKGATFFLQLEPQA